MRRDRTAYTLLEVLLALAISVMLLGAVYSVVGYQLRYAQAGRDLVEKTVLARAVLQRVTGDISTAVTLGDPARFRRQQAQQSGGSGDGNSGAGAAGGAAAGAAPAAGAAGAAPAAGAAGGTTDGSGGTSSGLQLPLGVIGTPTELHLFLSRVPTEAFDTGDGAQVTCDLRRVSYWVPDEAEGLCRMEVRLVTSDDATNTTLPSDVSGYRFAPEVKQVEFSYFDGSSWLDSWDSTELGQDNVTPKGSPRAIAVKISVQVPGHKELKTYRHVVHVMTAGGTPAQSSTGSGTTTP